MEKQIRSGQALEQVLADIKMVNTVLDFHWRFETVGCLDSAMPGWFVRVAFSRPDTNSGVMGVGYGRWEFVANGTTESGVVKTCWLLVELVIRHELMEGFRWRDKRIFNPHNTVEALASIQG